MQHLTIADKPLLIGDQVAGLLIAYAGVLGTASRTDHVTMQAYGQDGEKVAAPLRIDSCTDLVTESFASPLPEPDNSTLEQYLRRRLDSYRNIAILWPDTHTDDAEEG